MFDTMISTIIDFVIDNGYLTETNTFVYNGIEVQENDICKRVIWGSRLRVYQVVDEGVVFVDNLGDYDELMILYTGILNEISERENLDAANSE